MERAVTINDIEKLASENLHKNAYDYYRAGANACHSLNDNVEKFKEIPLKIIVIYLHSIIIKTRAFVDPSKFKGLETTIMGHKKMTHEHGELAMARGAQAYHHTPFMLSSWSTTPLEDVASEAPDCLKMFQIYLSKIPDTIIYFIIQSNYDVNKDLWLRVKESGYKALGLTIDTQLLGKRENDIRNNFQLPQGLNMATIQLLTLILKWILFILIIHCMANYAKYNKTHGENADIKSSGKDSGLAEYVRNHKDQNIGWEIINEIKKISGLPVIAKGIMCKEDALIALEYGADSLFVSNHGARQLDTTPATIEILAEVMQTLREKGLDKKIEVYFDGGVRRGTDVLKALALGAKAVFLGRAILWALAAGGQQGVEKTLKIIIIVLYKQNWRQLCIFIINEELIEAMVRCGCYSVEDIHKQGHNIIYDEKDLLFTRHKL